MIDLKSIIENESVEDILLFLAPRLPWHRIDYWFLHYKSDVIASGELMRITTKMVDEGKLKEDETGHISEGPHWAPPQFVVNKKYGIK
ncbi:immunity protein [Pantoea sp. FN060301]|uniref:immunity protein n=1 Tax=Pantoea sp. FN060301 TaxID=3420380 RepID=UPI003D173C96